MSTTGNSVETECSLVVAREREEEGVGPLLVGVEFLFGIMKMSWNYVLVIVTQLCENSKKILECLRVNFMVYELDLNFKNCKVGSSSCFSSEHLCF